MEEECPKCSRPTEVSHPPKFSPDDRYLRLRIEAKLRSRETGEPALNPGTG